ncbi:MAG: hypothetical protein AAF483_20455 [Planctomycetota bacterium]
MPRSSFAPVALLFALLTTLLGALVGYYFFLKTPESFRAQGLFQVSQSLVLNEEKASRIVIEDFPIIIKSEGVLRGAIEFGKLTEKELFAGLDAASLIEILKQSDDLTAESAAKESGTVLIVLSYTCSDSELAADVVGSIFKSLEAWAKEEGRQFEVKPLNLPKFGSFYGPMIAPFVASGAAIGFVLGLLVAFLLLSSLYPSGDRDSSSRERLP